MSSCLMGHLFLLFCRKCCTMDYECDVYCQHCLKEDIYVRVVSKCKTVLCCVNKDCKDVKSDCCCLHESCSVSAICILYRPVLFSMVDMIRLGSISPFRGVTRSEILLDMNYSKEQSVISTEILMNSLTLFKRFEEVGVMECGTREKRF